MSGRPHFAPQLSRRQWLARAANGFGGLALLDLLARDARAGVKPPHHPAKAKSVIFLFMDGGPSQIDTFDPKPNTVHLKHVCDILF